jgi:putative oxidoreductase
MNAIQQYAPVIGRILLALIFLSSGIHKIGGFEGTLGYMASRGMPAPQLFLIGAIVLEIAGSLSVILGYKARLGAAALILFTVPTMFIFHNFWTYPPDQAQMQFIMFMKNLSIVGGLLLVVGFGAGPKSLDNCQCRKS